MNGAQALIRTLVGGGVTVCFSNPGTSEMHFVAALDQVPEMRSVLGLFEGVVTGAADGYARMAGKPAATLLHLGPGLGNGVANLHNARRARSPIVNIVGDHAIGHKRFDAPLESDIETIARNVSGWVRTSSSTAALATDAAEAVHAAIGPPGQVATLILPADVSWSDGASPAGVAPGIGPKSVGDDAVATVAKVLASGEPAVLLVGGNATSAAGLAAASRVARATRAKLLCETFPARLARGQGVATVERVSYLAEFAAAQLLGTRHLVLVDAAAPVSFFAYPGKPSELVPDGCDVHRLAGPGEDAVGALEQLADLVAAKQSADVQALVRHELPVGPLTAETFARALGALLPEGAVISDEAQTSGIFLAGETADARRHDVLTLTGGSIGQGLPVATGAAVACPDRKVVCLAADGSAMYTLQALWTQGRDGLDVTTVFLNNGSYAVLNMELSRVGVDAPGPKALDMLDLSRPDLDFVALSAGMGVEGVRVDTSEEFCDAFARAMATPGPQVIEAMVPRVV